jgi:RecA-family ATPase
MIEKYTESEIRDMLDSIPVSSLDYNEWLEIGMALKEGGYPCDLWDSWSQGDTRYKRNECIRKWDGFKDHGVTIGTLVKKAKDYGWHKSYKKIQDANVALEWDSVLGAKDVEPDEPEKSWDPRQDLLIFLKILFKPSEYVSYVTSDYWKDEEGKIKPGRGMTRKASDLIKELEEGKPLDQIFGSFNEKIGAWIRFNPLKERGSSDRDVTRYSYALVECDHMDLHDQISAYKMLRLPIATMTFSGKKSIHAVVRVDAENEKEYRSRVDRLYEILKSNGIIVDTQNKNPSRMTRLPGVIREGKQQRLLDVNIGCKSWQEWEEYIDGTEDNLPEFTNMSEIWDNMPPVNEELIKGVLRVGHKMLLSGSSKAGKSFLLLELCYSIAEGKPWLGFEVKQGKVLYINLEIDPASVYQRIKQIYMNKGETKANTDVKLHLDNFDVWNLRGQALPLDKLLPRLVRRAKNGGYAAIVLDPIYKVITGDENNASEMGAFCNLFDRVCRELGCSVIYCHHHSKGAQGGKKAMDRASGSGVFARDPDAQLDLIQLQIPEELQGSILSDGDTAWQLEGTLREFPNFKPVKMFFKYPNHLLDTEGVLDRFHPEGSPVNNLRNKNNTGKDDRLVAVVKALESAISFNENGATTTSEISTMTGVSQTTVKRYLRTDLLEYFTNKNGLIFKNNEADFMEDNGLIESDDNGEEWE